MSTATKTGVPSGSNGTGVVSSISPGARFWRARVTDGTATQSAWSATRTMTVVQDMTWHATNRTWITKVDGTLWLSSSGKGCEYGNGLTGPTQQSYAPVQVQKSSGVPFTNAILAASVQSAHAHAR